MEFFNEPIRDLIAKNVDIDKDFTYEQFKVGRSNITFKVFDLTYYFWIIFFIDWSLRSNYICILDSHFNMVFMRFK